MKVLRAQHCIRAVTPGPESNQITITLHPYELAPDLIWHQAAFYHFTGYSSQDPTTRRTAHYKLCTMVEFFEENAARH